jgi:hypothetical protein
MIKRSNISHTTQAAFARELGVDRSTVAGYVRRGMPIRADGKLDRDACLKWIGAHVQAQVGSRGVGARGAERLTGSQSTAKPNGNRHDEPGPLAVASIRLNSLRADKLGGRVSAAGGRH